MSRSIKPKNNDYLDSTGIVHERTLLSEILKDDNIFKYKGSVYKNVNYDTLKTGWYTVNTWTGTGGSNWPEDNVVGILIAVENNHQICFGQSKIYMRHKGSSAWASWIKVNLS